MNNIKDFDISIMGFLLENPIHGYQLHKQISELTDIGAIWRIKIANLYAILKKLEHAGYIQAKITQDGNRPARNKYYLTENGREIFLGWVNDPVSKGRDFRIIFLIKLFYAIKSGKNTAIDLINSQKEICRSWLNEWSSEKPIRKSHTEFTPFITRFRQTQVQAYLYWLDWCEQQI